MVTLAELREFVKNGGGPADAFIDALPEQYRAAYGPDPVFLCNGHMALIAQRRWLPAGFEAVFPEREDKKPDWLKLMNKLHVSEPMSPVTLHGERLVTRDRSGRSAGGRLRPEVWVSYWAPQSATKVESWMRVQLRYADLAEKLGFILGVPGIDHTIPLLKADARYSDGGAGVFEVVWGAVMPVRSIGSLSPDQEAQENMFKVALEAAVARAV